MIDSFVRDKLLQWADWRIRREDSGQGYPKRVPYYDLQPKGAMESYEPEFEEECFKTEKCVIALRVIDQKLYQAIELHYLTGLTTKRKLKELSCCENTYYTRIEIAHQRILGFMNDMAADIPLPTFKAGTSTV